MCRRFSLVLFLSFFSIISFSSSIVPYENLEHLIQSSDLIVLAQASQEFSEQSNETHSFYRNFEILETLKGQSTESIRIVSGKKVIGRYTNIIHGEFDFHSDQHYLLFLNEQPDGSYYPICLSYYVFQEVQKKGVKYLVPAYTENSLQVLQKSKEKILYVYQKDSFVSEIKAFTTVQSSINYEDIIAAKEIQSLSQQIKKASPAHCTYLRTNNGLRFRVENLDSQAFPIYYQNGQPECFAVQSEMQAAVNHMNENYKGVQLNLEGSISNYVPNCSDGRAYNISYFGGGYDVYMEQQLGTSRGVIVQFGDPCNEIPALNNCSGTVAFGGSWAVGSHNSNGETFNTAVYGYVVVNDGMGNCNCQDYSPGSPISDFASIMTHELSHTIGLNHISSSFGNANMNPISGSHITNLDIECVDDLYPSSTDGNTNENPNTPGQADLRIANCPTVSQNGTSLNITNLTVQNSGTASSPASRIGFYLSTDNNITVNDQLLATTNIETLSPNASTQLNRTITLADIADGTYVIGVIIDDINSINESNESNNSCFIESPRIVIESAPSGQPDLMISRCGSVSIQNNTISISNLHIRNQGTVSTLGSSVIKFYASLDQQINGNDILLSSTSLNGLNPGATESISHNMSIPFLADGTYTIGMVIDADDQLNESDESNNNCFDASSTLNINNSSLQADLDMTNCGTIRQSENQLYISNTIVKNIGNANTNGHSFIAYYLSENQQIDDTDIYLGYDYVQSLDAGSQSQESANFDLSSFELKDGEYYVGVIADFNDRISESNESNNSCRKNNPKIIIDSDDNEDAFTDLTVSCGTVSQNSNAITISSATVINSGNTIIDKGFFIGFYLSLDKEITTSDYLLELGQDYIPRMNIGQEISVDANFSLNGIPTGEYYFGIIVDHLSDISEEQEQNNSCHLASKKITVGSTSDGLPDLQTQCKQISIENDKIKLADVSVVNNGELNTGSYSFVGFYLSDDETINSDDYYLGYDFVGLLNPGQSSKEVETVEFAHFQLADGEYYIGAYADFTKRVNESHEENNTCIFSQTLIIGGGDEDQSGDPSDCTTLLHTDFENGQLAPWVDGGLHAFVNAGTSFSSSGRRSMALRGNAGEQSSIYLQNEVNTTSGTNFNLSFNLKSYLTESGDKLLVEIDRGSGYTTLREWQTDHDFQSNEAFRASVNFDSNQSFRLRIRSHTSHTYEYFFVDDLLLETCVSGNGFTTNESNGSSNKKSSLTYNIVPNPASDYVEININAELKPNSLVQIFDSTNSLVLEQKLTSKNQVINTANLPNGLYYVSVLIEDARLPIKLMIAH